ncbi:hypothetical protein GCM10025738_12010 [Microbacterium fluvii]
MGSREEAFVELFDEHWATVSAYVRRRLSDEGIAEEIAADVFRIAWEKQQPEDPFGRGWLLRTAMNRLSDHLRRHVRRTRAEEALARRLEEAPDRADLDDLLTLHDAMAGLAEREREALLLTYWEGLSADEVGEVLGCKPGAVWTMLTRARAKLRASIGEAAAVGGAKR